MKLHLQKSNFLKRKIENNSPIKRSNIREYVVVSVTNSLHEDDIWKKKKDCPHSDRIKEAFQN